MSLYTRLRERFAARLLGVVTRLVPTWQEGRELPQPHDFRALADEGYRQIIPVYACITQIATSAAEPLLKVSLRNKDGDLEETAREDALAHLLAHPNPEQTTFEFVELLITHLYVSGNAYVHKIRSRSGANIVQLQLLRPDRVEIVPGPGGMVLGYQYRLDGVKDPPRIEAEDVIHIKLPDPLDDYYGLSPIAVLARLGDLDTQSVDFLRTLFLNRGVPAGILKFQARVPEEQRAYVKAKWAEEYSGFKGWNRVAVLDGGVEFQSVGIMHDKLGMESILNQSETRIAAVFGVPPIIVGFWSGLQFATYANYETALRAFWLETLCPLYKRLGEKLTQGLAPEFDTDRTFARQPHVIHFDLSEIGALQEDIEGLRKLALEGWEQGLLSRNEARALVKQEPIDDGDVFKSWANQTLVPKDMPGDGSTGLTVALTRQEPGEVNTVLWRELVTEQERQRVLLLEGLRLMREEVRTALDAEHQRERLEGSLTARLDLARADTLHALQSREAALLHKISALEAQLSGVEARLETLASRPAPEPPQVHVTLPAPTAIQRRVVRDARNLIAEIIETPVEAPDAGHSP